MELLTSHDKEYIASVELGYSTDTLDIEGEVIEECNGDLVNDNPDIKIKCDEVRYHLMSGRSD